MTVENTGATLLVDCLRQNGVQQAFAVPGESYLAVLDALYDVRDEIALLGCRQEGGAAYMAEAWGKLTGEPGICFVTRGPGATNASIGVHTAMQDSSPMILFIGQVGVGEKGREAFQEIDYRAFFSPICKWATEIDDPARIPEIVSRAFAVARSGRPGPVVIGLPEDMLTAATNVAPCAATIVSPPSISADTTASIKAHLEKAQRPLIMIGGSSWTEAGTQALQSLVDSYDIPVMAGFRRNDLIDNHHPCYVGEAGVGITPAARKLIDSADLVLALGLRLGEISTGAYTYFDCPVPQQTLIQVHPDSDELGKVYQAAMHVQASPALAVQSLIDAKLEPAQNWSGWCKEARDGWHAALRAPEQPGNLDMGEVMAWLRNNLPEDVIITNGAGNFTIWPSKYMVYGAEARLLAPQSGAMGYGLPAAVAAKARYPQRTVVCFCGDGDFQMNSQELGSAMQAGVQPIVLVINNGMYGTIRMHQERNYPTRVSGTEITNPDFVQLARAYGYHAERIEKTDEFAAAFERAQKSASGAMIELVVDPQMLTPQQSIDQARAAST
jgi:acetolactate synthase-1/2/3 large subunit